MKLIRIAFILAFPLSFFSCKPVQQLPHYLENISDTSITGDVKVPELIIQKNDQLAINIISLSTKPNLSDSIYNQSAPYLVDVNGNIEHHRLGIIKAEGMTKGQLADEVKKRLTEPVELMRNPTVLISLTNFKVTVLGQVGREGVVNVPGERLTIFEAIGLAGGITEYGKKTNLKIVREINGKRETGVINLSSKEIFDSPFYYMKQNDLVFIEPTNQKLKDAEQLKTMQKVSFAFTIVTVAATIASIFIRN